MFDVTSIMFLVSISAAFMIISIKMLKKLRDEANDEVNDETNSDDSKPFSCHCGKVYKKKTYLRQHQRFDCGVEPSFSCEYCWAKFSRKPNLKRHIALVHLHQRPGSKTPNNESKANTSEKQETFPCHCGKSYKTKQILQRHQTFECGVEPTFSYEQITKCVSDHDEGCQHKLRPPSSSGPYTLQDILEKANKQPRANCSTRKSIEVMVEQSKVLYHLFQLDIENNSSLIVRFLLSPGSLIIYLTSSPLVSISVITTTTILKSPWPVFGNIANFSAACLDVDGSSV
uniref:C2H2-type domain-containing protein n=1 Tax=Megaselia scalaris TaxID=36166 RepID=T1GF64_MEGSC